MAKTRRARISEELIENIESQIISEQNVVDYRTREYPVSVIVDLYKSGTIFVPSYQRAFVWSNEKQARFIESILLDMPIPYLFTADNRGKQEIVDGSQRIRTLNSFLANELVLKNLKRLPLLNGFRFSDLPQTRQLTLEKTTIRLIELTAKATVKTRKDLFDRINSKPEPLTPMENRRGLYEGPVIDFISDCAKDERFNNVCPISDKRKNRFAREELVSRFFAYSNNLDNFKHSVEDFIDSYVSSLCEEVGENDTENILERHRREFDRMLEFVDTHFELGFRRAKNDRSVPNVRFEAIAVGVNLALRDTPNLQPVDVSWIGSDEFVNHTTTHAANNRDRVTGRIFYVRDQLLAV